MNKFAAAGLSFLLAVLWFDLMFDTQTRAYAGDLPPEVLASISAYYRRVTTDAVRLGSAVDTLAVQSDLARAIYHDHRFGFARTALVLGLQLFAK